MGTGDKVEEVSRGQDPGALGSRQKRSHTQLSAESMTLPMSASDGSEEGTEDPAAAERLLSWGAQDPRELMGQGALCIKGKFWVPHRHIISFLLDSEVRSHHLPLSGDLDPRKLSNPGLRWRW